MGTCSRQLCNGSIRMPKNSHLGQSPANDGIRFRRNVVTRRCDPWSQPIGILKTRIERFPGKFASGERRYARWIVHRLPSVLVSQYQLAEEDASKGSMSQSHSGVAGCDKDIRVIHWIGSNISQPIHRFHDLSRPLVVNPLHHWKSSTCPLFK